MRIRALGEGTNKIKPSRRRRVVKLSELGENGQFLRPTRLKLGD
jgi:hypothetical protein